MGIHARTTRDLSPCERWIGARICCLKVYTQAKFRVPLDPLSLPKPQPVGGEQDLQRWLIGRWIWSVVGRGRCLSVAKGDGRVWMNSVRDDEFLLLRLGLWMLFLYVLVF